MFIVTSPAWMRPPSAVFVCSITRSASCMHPEHPGEDARVHVLHALPIKLRLVSTAIHLQRSSLPDRVRPDKDPVLPCRETTEDARQHRFRLSKAKVGLKAGECVGGERHPRFDGETKLVSPVQLVGSGGHQTSLGRIFGGEFLADQSTHGPNFLVVAVEPRNESRHSAD